MRIENSDIRDNYSASLSKPRDAEHLPLWLKFQSAPHNHLRFLYFWMTSLIKVITVCYSVFNLLLQDLTHFSIF